MTKRVAIIGAAHRFPGTTPETFWQDLQAEKDFVTQVAPDRWSQEAFWHPNKRNPGTSVTFAAGSLGDISGFDPEFFGISPREAANMDPQQRMLLELTWEAMEDAGIKPGSLRGSQCGVFLGVASLDYSYRIADDMAAIDASTATGNTSSIASNRVSYVFDLHGPSMSLDTACSSSMVAFHQACQAIRSGETNMALAGGISLHLHPYGFIIFSKASMLSPTGRCQVFDEAGNGYVRSEGAGLFMLKDYDDAVADGDQILAVVAGSAVNTDGHKSGLTVPNPSAQIDLMRRAYQQAGITPDEIDYLEAHGTGTAVGDPIESRAIGEALGMHRQTPLPIGSIKSNLGHLETASGVAGLAKALYSLKHREVPATIGIRKLNPRIKFDEWNISVVTQAQALKKHGRLVIGVNSFGFGGANAHVILESPPENGARSIPASQPSEQRSYPVRISGRSDGALTDNIIRLIARLRDDSSDAFYDIAHTLHQHREHHAKGALVFAHSAEQAADALAHFIDDTDNHRPAPDATPLPSVTVFDSLNDAKGPVFVYDGNGCQWETMGRDLIDRDAVFAAAIDQVDQLFKPLGGFSLADELRGDNGTERFERTEIAQPALFALQVALTQWLAAHGVQPVAVFGHSVGEVAAAWASGALSLADAVKVIHYRSHFQGQTRGQGEMTAVALGADAIRPWLAQAAYKSVHLAGINSPNGVTLAGDPAQLASLEAALAEQSIFAKRLPLDYAFHSPAMDTIASGVIDALETITPGQTRIPYISTVTGQPLEGTALDATYWWQNIREPVRFHAAATHLTAQGFNVFVEMGAHPILRRYLTETQREQEVQGVVLSTIERARPGPECMETALGKLLLSGVDVDTQAFFPIEGQRVSLPRYAWQRQSLWLSPSSDSQGLLDRYYQHPLLGYPMAQQARTWESQLDIQRQPWLAGHVVGEGAVFPGAGFVELALAAALQRQDTPVVDIEELEIRAPLLLDTPHGRLMRLHMGEHDGRMEIRSREPAVGQEWQLNGVARMLQETCGSLLERRVPKRPTRAPDYTLDQHLAMAEHLGLHYSGAFQAIGHGWIEGNRVVGEIIANESLLASQQGLHLHPGILDSAFQMFIPLLAQQDTASLAFVPVRVGRIQLDTQAGTPILAHAVMGKRSPHSFTADFELFDAQGKAVAILSEVRFKAIRLNRSHDQALSYLDIQLTPAPLESSGLATPDDAMARLSHLVSAYGTQTGERYANEVAPLLDRLSEAFSEVQNDEDQPTPQAIWQLLVQDYPDYFAPIHLVGRLGLHRQALQSGNADSDSLGINNEQLSRLNRVLVGESGWQSIAGQLTALLDTLLESQPAGQRLCLLEAGCCVPALGERLLEHLAHSLQGQRLEDVFHQRILPTTEAGMHQAEQLQEAYPLVDIHPLDAAMPHLHDGEKAQLALVSLDVTRRHLLVTDNHEDPLARSLRAALERRQEAVLLIDTQAAPASVLNEAIEQPVLAEQAELALNVVDLRGLPGNPGYQPLPVDSQTQRCELARQWTLALEAARIKASLWLTTQGVGALWQPHSVAQSLDHAVAADAALWGFGRSLANEAVEHDVRLVDLPGEPNTVALACWAASLSNPDAESELVISPQGQRFATRLRTLPAPSIGNSEQVSTHSEDACHSAMTLGFAMPGQLRQLQWRPRALPALGADDVEIKVKATGLNFRDVMYTLGLLSDEAIENGFAGPTLGLEFAGEVVTTGEAVTHLSPGDAVVGFGPASFSDRLIAGQHALAPLPEGISYAAAATIPTTFFTVYYALKHLARLEPGEKILIHGAAGGVGIAALQIAQWLGAEIYATVGSQEKRDFLQLMGIENLYDSRSLTFAEEILQDTGGEGVDVVLNSLAGEAINQNLRALRPFGRFLELGKRDFYENTHIGLRPFRNNLSYFGIDSDQLMKVQPALTQRLFGEMMALFNDGTLSPLPFTAFNHSQVIDAFRYMQQARQIGKVVVTYEQPIAAKASQPLGNSPLALSSQASYLVTGGLGGFGLKTAQWLVDKGAKALILVSRSGPASEEAQAAIATFEAQGVTVLAAACDITDRQALAGVLADARQTLPPLHGIVHAATVIDDSLIRNLNAERIHKVLAPKIDGARHLDALTRDCPLDFFVVYSSATTLFGNPGQANYVAANHWLEAFAANRRQQGQPATCVRWGAIEDVGFLARNTRTRDALQERLGGSALRSDDALKVLEQMLLSPLAAPSLGVLELDWSALARFLPTANTPRFKEIARNSAVVDLLRAELASILLIEEDKIDPQRSVYEMGFDSLMGVELMTAIENRLGVAISVMVLSEASTLDKLAGVLILKLQQNDEDTEEAPQDALASLAARHGTQSLEADTNTATREIT